MPSANCNSQEIVRTNQKEINTYCFAVVDAKYGVISLHWSESEAKQICESGHTLISGYCGTVEKLKINGDIPKRVKKAVCNEGNENRIKTPGFDHLSHGWHYEDQLPSKYPYNWGYKRSKIVDGVRMFPPHKCYFIRSLDGLTEICECGAWR